MVRFYSFQNELSLLADRYYDSYDHSDEDAQLTQESHNILEEVKTFVDTIVQQIEAGNIEPLNHGEMTYLDYLYCDDMIFKIDDKLSKSLVDHNLIDETVYLQSGCRKLIPLLFNKTELDDAKFLKISRMIGLQSFYYIDVVKNNPGKYLGLLVMDERYALLADAFQKLNLNNYDIQHMIYELKNRFVVDKFIDCLDRAGQKKLMTFIINML